MRRGGRGFGFGPDGRFGREESSLDSNHGGPLGEPYMNSPSEFRRDPISGDWVIIAPQRSLRPDEFHESGAGRTPDVPSWPAPCPFCAGRECATPPEVAADREPGSAPDGPGWRVRIVPNKFPAVARDAAVVAAENGPFERRNGFGIHEVVIESPDHDADFSSFAADHAASVLRLTRDRLRRLEAEEGIRYVHWFKNRGREAGASLRHPHSQIVALPFIPGRVRLEIEAAARFGAANRACLFCRTIGDEIRDGRRLVLRGDAFIVTAPFAARFPFETHLHPIFHAPSFARLGDSEIAILAETLQTLLRGLKGALDDPPYDIVLHQAPGPDPSRPNRPEREYHWHLEIFPVLTRVAGFEWGTGVFINPIPPERAAAALREILA